MLAAYSADEKERTKRMKAMRKTVAEHDVAAWAGSFLEELGGTAVTHEKT